MHHRSGGLAEHADQGWGWGATCAQLPSLNGDQEVFLPVSSPALIVPMLCLGELKVSRKDVLRMGVGG